ncbi:hypothetical protein [Histophilus somni]|uniref:hypothetical protein n=1 Tax=Histophilus somni TaxID=731 RepID=UPI000A980955|nr:hypothetical protein [Histophilus somni]
MAVGKANKEGLTDEQKAMYDQAFSQRQDYFDKRRRSFDSFGNGIATVLGTGVDIASKGLTMGQALPSLMPTKIIRHWRKPWKILIALKIGNF